jgi:hypothetical protein
MILSHPSEVVLQSRIIYAGIGLGVLVSGIGGAVIGQQLDHPSELVSPVITSGGGVFAGIGVWLIYVFLSYAVSARFATPIIIAFLIIEVTIAIAIYRILSAARATVQESTA